MVWINYFWLIPLGWISGVLVNYLCDVLPWKRKIAQPFCLQCKHNQSWFNYFVWPRRCVHCQKSRSLRTWLIELVYILVTVWLWQNHPEKLGYWGGLFLAIYFGVVVVIDIEHRLILHPVSLFGALSGFLVGAYMHGWWESLLGGLVGFGSMLLLYWLGELLLRLAAKLRGETVDDVALGFGDVNLSGVLGLILGFPGIVLGLFVAIMVAGLVSLVFLVVMLLVRKYRLFMALPYGPFLVFGAVTLLYFRDMLAQLFN